MQVQLEPRRRTLCILGGTGFVGSHLLPRLSRDGHRLRVLTRSRERHRDLWVLPDLEMLEADVHDPFQLERAFAGCDAVINLVGILNEKGRDGKGFERAHVELPRKVVAACRLQHVPRLLHMSALGADAGYGHSRYQRSKGEGENVAHAATGLRVTSFRPSVVFGPGDSFFNRFAALLRIAPGVFPLACPDARFAPVYVGDVVEAYARALNIARTHGKRYELCGPRVYTLKELVEYTARALKLRRKVIGLGRGLSHLQAALLEHFPGKPFSLDNFHSMQSDNVCQGPFPEVFGLTPTPLESVVPFYLGDRNRRGQLDTLRARQQR